MHHPARVFLALAACGLTITLAAQPATLQEAFDLELEAQQWSMDRPWFKEHVRALRDRLQSRRRG